MREFAGVAVCWRNPPDQKGLDEFLARDEINITSDIREARLFLNREIVDVMLNLKPLPEHPDRVPEAVLVYKTTKYSYEGGD